MDIVGVGFPADCCVSLLEGARDSVDLDVDGRVAGRLALGCTMPVMGVREG